VSVQLREERGGRGGKRDERQVDHLELRS